jgi:hypothetical protein
MFSVLFLKQKMSVSISTFAFSLKVGKQDYNAPADMRPSTSGMFTGEHKTLARAG